MCVSVFMCKHVQTYTHKWARVSEPMDVIGHQPASPGLVCTHRHTTVSKALPNQGKMTNNYDLKSDYEATLHIATPHFLPSLLFLTRCGPSSGQAMLTKWKKVICIK